MIVLLLRRARTALQRSQTTGPLLLATTVGLLSGAGAIVLRLLIRAVQVVFFGGSTLVPDPAEFLPGNIHYLLAPAIGMVVVSWMVLKWAPEARGHGVPEVQYALRRKGGRIRPRVALVKAVASAISIGSGGSVGREGPIVQIGSSLGSTIGQFVGLRADHLRVMVAAGAAGAIGATFNAPIAGVMFALEVILGSFASRSFGLVVVASVTATVLTQAVLGTEPAFRLVESFTLVSEWELPLYVVLGVLGGLVGLTYTRTVYAVETGFDSWRVGNSVKALAGGLAVGALGFFGSDLIFGVGHEGAELALAGALGAGLMLALVMLKILATAITLGAGGSGGVFAPALFAGGMLGGSFGKIMAQVWPGAIAPSGAYALVGMGAVFAAATHAPITAIVILFEMTDNYRIILPLMLAAVVAYLIASRLNPDSIYSIKLRRMGGMGSTARELGVLDLVLVDDAMASEFETVGEDASLDAFADLARRSGERSWPVVDGEDKLVGIVTETDLERALLQEDPDGRRVADIMTRSVLTATPGQSLRHAFQRFADLDVFQVPVVSPDDPSELLGVLRRSELLWAFREMSDEHHRLLERTGWSIPAARNSVQMELQVDLESEGFAFRPVRSLDIPPYALTVLIRRADRMIVPRGNTLVEPGDVLVLLTTREREQDLRRWMEIHLGQS